MLLPTMAGLEIGTVDGMQGREKEAVILSLVRSNDKAVYLSSMLVWLLMWPYDRER
jgi:hypothetical protein